MHNAVQDNFQPVKAQMAPITRCVDSQCTISHRNF